MLKGYRFRPGWATTLAAVMVVPILVGLGLWQLDRAREKIEIRDHYRARARMETVDINRATLDPASSEFRRGTARGRYRKGLTVYLDNKVLHGVPGYQILTPLELFGAGSESSGERFILVNRGWIPWGESRRTLPPVDTPGGVITVSGRLETPPGDYFTLEDQQSNEFAPLWENLDLARYREVTGLAVAPLVLQLDPDDTRGGGFAREWPKFEDPWIERHRAYAVQWFAMAFIVAVLYLVLNLVKGGERDG